MKEFAKHAVLAFGSAVFGNQRGKVIFYHDVCEQRGVCKTPTPIGLFMEQVRQSRIAGWVAVTGIPKEDKTFSVQFDDGFRGVYECRTALADAGVKPTVNLSVATIGREGYLTRAEILELREMGFSFQSHTWNHVWLPECSDAELKHELDDSRKWLEDFLQTDVSQICFPRGLFSRRVYDAAIAAGYSDLVTCIPGAWDEGMMPHLVPRQIVQDATPTEFVAILNGGMRPFKNRYFKRQYVEDRL